jgi:Zn-finger protein
MKKMEALKLIEEQITPCNSCYKDHRKKAAERILNALLKAGFLPPRYMEFRKMTKDGQGCLMLSKYRFEDE